MPKPRHVFFIGQKRELEVTSLCGETFASKVEGRNYVHFVPCRCLVAVKINFWNGYAKNEGAIPNSSYVRIADILRVCISCIFSLQGAVFMVEQSCNVCGRLLQKPRSERQICEPRRGYHNAPLQNWTISPVFLR